VTTAKSALLLASLLLACGVVPTAARADAAAGARLAQQWCANCHVIDHGGVGTTVPQGPPSFATVARRLDARQLRVFLSHPHAPMPDLALTRAEINDLIAYIETLK
jgi:mono/diheme cytochrome c family protein